jgi:hypothetical protein
MMSLCIYLYINAHPMTASARHTNATITRHPGESLCSLRTFDSTYIIQRNSSAIEVQRKQVRRREEARKAREKQKSRDASNAKNMKGASVVTSRSCQNNVIQLPGGATQTQPTPGLIPDGISASFTIPAIPSTSVGTTCCTRVWSAICCASAQNADGHH